MFSLHLRNRKIEKWLEETRYVDGQTDRQLDR